MNFTKSFIPAALAMMTVAFSSCSDDGYWNAGSSAAADTVTADEQTTLSATYGIGEEIPDPTFELSLSRGTTSGTETVALTAAQADATGDYTVAVDPTIWSVPSSVTFADGQQNVTIPVTLVTTEAGTYKLQVSVADASQVALGGVRSWTITAKIKGATPDPEWESLGTGEYVNNFFFDYTYQVEIEKDYAEYEKDQLGYYGHYRLVKPYSEGFYSEGYFEDGEADTSPEYVEFYVVGPGQTITTASDQEIPVPEDSETYYLYIPAYNTGWYYSYYGAYVLAMYGANFTSATLAGDFAGQIIRSWKTEPTAADPQGYPEVASMGCYYYMSGIGGWDYTTSTKDIYFVFPGCSLGDYSFTLAYGGHLIDAEQLEYIVSDVDFTGADVAYVYTGVVETANASDALEILQNSIAAVEGDEDAAASTDIVPVEKLTASGSAKFQVEASGDYTIAAISYDSDGNAKESQTVLVKFTSINDLGGDTNWESLGVGEYHDDILTLMYNLNSDYLTYEVEVQRNINEPSLYRIVDPYKSGVYPYNLTDLTTIDQYMEFDTSNPQVVKIPPFAVGTIGSYGTCTVYSYSYYLQALGYPDDVILEEGVGGTFELGVISFPANGILAELSALGKIYYTNSDGLTELVIPEGGYTVNRTRKAVKSQAIGSVRAKAVSKASQFQNPFAVKSTKRVPSKFRANREVNAFRVPMLAN